MKKQTYGDIKDVLKNELLGEDDPETVELIRQLRHIQSKGYFTHPEFLKMCRWKSPRPLRWYKANTALQVEEVARAVLSTSNERHRIKLLTALKGVEIPTASAILTLIDPERYGVIDIRVWQFLYRYGAVSVKPGGQGFTFDDWDNYLSLLRHLAEEFSTTVRLIEWTLFECHKATQQGTLYQATSRRGDSRTSDSHSSSYAVLESADPPRPVGEEICLVLNAPHSRFRGIGETFDEMLSSGAARGYILSEKQSAQLNAGCKVVLLDKETERRAEGQLKELERTEKAGNGMQRFDVHFQNGKQVAYKSERLNRNGIAVI